MTLFWIFFGIDTLVAIVVLFFFFTGLSDGSVSSFNMGLWIVLLLVSIGVLLCGFYLKSIEKIGLAKILLGIEAIPATLFFLFFLLMILSKPNWH